MIFYTTPEPTHVGQGWRAPVDRMDGLGISRWRQTWKDSEDLQELKPHRIRSAGWVLREDKESLVIVGHIAEFQCSGDLCIPKSAIVKRRVLER